MNCVCGDVFEEHEPVAVGVGGCEVPGCGCVQFEWDGEEDSGSDV